MLGKKICVGWNRLILCLPVVIIIPRMLSVLEFQKQTNLRDLHNEKPKKFNHLILGPAAGEGLPDRLHCQGTKALNETRFGTFSNSSGSGEHVAFVSVFTVYNSNRQVNTRPVDLVTVGKTSYNKVERSMAILNVFINFIQAFLETRLEKLTQRQEQVNHFIFTDSDIAVVKDLGQIFTDYPNFDLALTFRNNKDQPLNSGFIAVRGTAEGIRRGKAFLQEVLEVYSSKFMKASRMLGDQLAFAWVVKSYPNFDTRRFSRREAFLDKIGSASVLFLPCSSFNWTPPEGAGQFHGMPLDVKVVHFKGSRKRLMLEAWNFFSSNSDMSNMLCLILKSGRTKYDF